MIDNLTNTLLFIIQQTQHNMRVLLWIMGVLFGSYLLTLATHKQLLLLGIRPRRAWGLVGIIFAPLLHANFNHLFYNLIPLIILSDFLLVHGLPYFITITILICILSGFLTWLFAKPGIHVGASAVITGYWGVLVCDIYQQGTLMAIILGASTLYAFAGIFLGIFPSERGVSWEGHLFGLISGVTISYLLK